MANNRTGNEHISDLEEAREKVIEQRREIAKAMAAGNVRENAEFFATIQEALAAVEHAIQHEQELAPRDLMLGGRRLPPKATAPV